MRFMVDVRRTERARSSVLMMAAVTAMAVAACAPEQVVTPSPTPPSEAALPGPRPAAPQLPPIPRVDGPLELRVSYPRKGGFVATRGENFIFGSAGSGAARVWINDREVEVQPNGGFLAFVPVPADGVYRLRASRGEDTASLELRVDTPPAPTPAPAPAAAPVIVDGSPYPTGGWVALPGERIQTGFRGSAGGRAWLVLPDGARIPLVADQGPAAREASPFEVAPPAAAAGTVSPMVWYRGFFAARRLVTADTTVAWPTLTGEARTAAIEAGEAARERRAGAPLGVIPQHAVDATPGAVPGVGGPDGARNAGAYVELEVDGRTVRRPLQFNLALADPDRPRVGVAWDPLPPEQNGNQRHIGRTGPGGGPFHYVWRNGTELELTGERDGAYRVRLTDDLSAWSPAGKIQLRPAHTPPPTVAGGHRADGPSTRVDRRTGGPDRRLPYAVEEGDRSLSLLVYGAVSQANFLQHGRVDPFIERGEWSQPSDRLFRLDIQLSAHAVGIRGRSGGGRTCC
jgi:N-acetylmuramoyl-L-alanine amidase